MSSPNEIRLSSDTRKSRNNSRLTNPRRLGIRVPIRESRFDGLFDVTTNTLEKVKSQLYVLLFTETGSRVMMPSFGSPIYSNLFEAISDGDLEQIRVNIIRQAEVHVPEAEISSVEFMKDENTVEIKINFNLRANPSNEDSLVITARN